MKAISLFSSAGLGELGIRAHGIEIVVANEILKDRCGLYQSNFDETEMIEGDVWLKGKDIVNKTRSALGPDELFLVYATPPCQGMSTNGVGKLRAEIAAGNRSEEDQRNRLIIPAMDIICTLKPLWILFENVPGMQDTSIRTDRGQENIISYIERRLGNQYVGGPQVVSCADYGIPQLRRRLITVYTRSMNGAIFMKANRLSVLQDNDRRPMATLWDAISGLPALDGSAGKSSRLDFNEFHYVNVLGKEKYWWIENTPEGETAYNNQCPNTKCMFKGNPRHVDFIEGGRWVSNKSTPIYCQKCGELLPRPTMIDKITGQRRLISGFHSAYRRMDKDKPAHTLTRNFPFEASDNKIHPTQNRVLSIYEALIIQTIAEYKYIWEIKGKKVTRSLMAQAIGESVPPKLIDIILRKIILIDSGEIRLAEQLSLFG